QCAAPHPERISALVLINPYARVRRSDDYPQGLVSDEDIAAFQATFRDEWGTGAALSTFAPSVADDSRFTRWLARCERLSQPPEEGYSRALAAVEGDLRHRLRAVLGPALCVARSSWEGPQRDR